MTVGELIQELREYPSDIVVSVGIRGQFIAHGVDGITIFLRKMSSMILVIVGEYESMHADD